MGQETNGNGNGEKKSYRNLSITHWMDHPMIPGHMLAMVARSAMDREATPSPKNSTNFPTTPI